jgi:hypothetical protein
MRMIVESFFAPGEKTISPIRVRPAAGQKYSPNMRVECSRAMRVAFPVGQMFCIYVTLKSRLGSQDFLYSSYRYPWNPVTKEEAATFIAQASK